MECFKFVSDRGYIEFSLVSPYKLTSCENLNGAETQKNEHKYIACDGAEYTDILYEPDELSIKGFVKAQSKETLPYLRAEFYKILNGKESGILYYCVQNKEYFTEVLPIRPLVSDPIQNVMNFTAKFLRLAPLWKLFNINKNYIYRIENVLKTEFTLPCEFSVRTFKCRAVNNGDTDSAPVFKIKCTKAPLTTNENIISIKNSTTGKSLSINYSPIINETITIDTEKCTIVSDICGNIINKITSDSEFFELSVGSNDIEVKNTNMEYTIYATLEYYNKVLGV